MREFLYSVEGWGPGATASLETPPDSTVDTRPYRLQVYGPFRMTGQSGEPVAFAAKTASAVLAFLALSKGRLISRKELAQALWPDHDGAAAMTNLRTALHRTRKALGGLDPVCTEGEHIRLNVEVVATDLEEADRLHRTFLLASNQPDGLDALAEEWQIRRHVLLEGWDFEWLESLRIAAEMVSSDVACDLAKHLEANGDATKAALIWRQLLDRVPHHAEALQHALRLEYQSHGKARALELANRAADNYRADLGIEMPRALQKIITEIRGGFYESVPKPELIRTRSELLLLARMFESNLKANRTEALAMLARECSSPTALAHPRTMLSLLILALNETEGIAPERIQVAVQATTLASWASEFEIGRRWANFVLDSLSPNDPSYAGVLSMLGFMYFEQRQYALAEKSLTKAIDIFHDQKRSLEALRGAARLAGVQWHRLKFEEAINTYLSVVESVEESSDPASQGLQAMCHGNLCYVYTAIGDWSSSIKHGNLCEKFIAAAPIYGLVYSAPLGLALYADGRREEGIRELMRSVGLTYREGLWRFNQISIDHAAVALSLAGRREVAECVLRANSDHREVLQHQRSPAELQLIREVGGIDVEEPTVRSLPNPLKGQSVGTLSQWVCEEFERVLASPSAISS